MRLGEAFKRGLAALPPPFVVELLGISIYSAAMQKPYLAFILLAVFTLCGSPALLYAQQQLPDLAQVKAAAEQGDVAAQDKLGEAYWWSFNFPAAVEWFRKAAEQGNAHAQWRLGEMLLEGKLKMGQSNAAVPKAPDEAVRWLLMAANQGFGLAQFAVGDCYHKGNGVRQDSVEAYKWYRLGSRENELGAKLRMNPLILKMTPQQIQEGEQRAKAFVPHRATKQEMPEPQYAQDLVLKGISGPPNRRLAMINNQTLAKGEEAKVKVGPRTVTVKCLEIKERSAIVQVEGVEQPKEISLR